MSLRCQLPERPPENRVIHNPILDPGHEKKKDREERDGSVVARQKNQDGKLGKEE